MIQIGKLLQVQAKLNELLRRETTIHIDKGIIVTLPSKYAKVQNTLFKVNQAWLREITDKFKIQNISQQALMDTTKDTIRLMLTQEVEAQIEVEAQTKDENEDAFRNFMNLIKKPT